MTDPLKIATREDVLRLLTDALEGVREPSETQLAAAKMLLDYYKAQKAVAGGAKRRTIESLVDGASPT